MTTHIVGLFLGSTFVNVAAALVWILRDFDKRGEETNREP